MAVLCGYSVMRSAASPSISAFRCSLCRLRISTLCRSFMLPLRYPSVRCENRYCSHVFVSSSPVHSLVDMVMEEFEESRRRRRVRVNVKMKLETGELIEKRPVVQELQKGRLLEFKKDTDRILLAVAQKPDGKKNWMVSDQNGVVLSIKPQQITYIVPGIENFEHTDISSFIEKAQNNLDLALLEFAWIELLEKNKSVTAEELAEMIFGCTDPLECYCAHLLLSKDELYFTVLEGKGCCSVYGPRPTTQVEELLRWKVTKEAAEKELQEFVGQLMSAKSMPLHSKPPKSSWMVGEKTRYRVECLEAYSIDACKDDDQKRTAGEILREMGLAKTAASAVNLLIDIGYFPVHVNLDMLKYGIRTLHSEEIVQDAKNLLSDRPDQDEIGRADLTHLKVYAIDVDEADELYDALSATRLQDAGSKCGYMLRIQLDTFSLVANWTGKQ